MNVASTYSLRDILSMLAREMFHEDRKEVEPFYTQPRTRFDIEMIGCEKDTVTLSIKLVR